MKPCSWEARGRLNPHRLARGVSAFKPPVLSPHGAGAGLSPELPEEARDSTRWRVVVRFVSLKEAARKARVDECTMRRWCTRGWVMAERLASGHGPWIVAVDIRGLPGGPA
uniref:Helix-turn-helix domain-containing protein n=1 Tax=Myxococcus fulvus TaxID=33 RepID=B0YR24_MYXFU|nr:hypothetical protein pMF1.15 [Myxococcus fulvus]